MSNSDMSSKPEVEEVALENTPLDIFEESNAGDGTLAADQRLTGLPLVLCIASCFISLFLIGLDQTITVTILKTIGDKFNGYENIGWVSSGYFLTTAVFAATWGRLSIVFGRKWTLLSSILLFEAGSLMCALASSMNILIGGRVLAGIGGSGIQTIVFIVGSEIVSIEKRALVFMCFSIAFAVSIVSGPLIGGAFTIHTSWRWCFYINLPLGGVAALMLSLFFNPPTPKGSLLQKLKSIDYIGLFFMTSGVVLSLLALTFGGVKFPWNSGAVISEFVLGGLLCIAFCVWNFKYSKHPIIPLNIVKVPQIDFALLTLCTTIYCFMGNVTYITTYFQVIREESAWQTGVHAIPLIIPLVVGAIGSGILMRTTGMMKPWTVFGCVCGAVGHGCLLLLKQDSGSSARIGLLILPGLYSGLVMQTTLLSGQLNSPKDAGSMLLTTALFNFGRSVASALGANISQATFDASYKNKITAVVKSLPGGELAGLSPNQAAKLIAKPELILQLPSDAQKIVKDVVMESIRNVFKTIVAVACLSVVLAIFNSNKKLPTAKSSKKKEAEESGEKVKTTHEEESA